MKASVDLCKSFIFLICNWVWCTNFGPVMRVTFVLHWIFIQKAHTHNHAVQVAGVVGKSSNKWIRKWSFALISVFMNMFYSSFENGKTPKQRKWAISWIEHALNICLLFHLTISIHSLLLSLLSNRSRNLFWISMWLTFKYWILPNFPSIWRSRNESQCDTDDGLKLQVFAQCNGNFFLFVEKKKLTKERSGEQTKWKE